MHCVTLLTTVPILFNYALGFHFLNYEHVLNEINKLTAHMDTKNIGTKWIEQPLDHFNKNDSRKLNMKYYERLDLWKPGGPIFVMIGGEGNASSGFLQIGAMYELAHQTNGAMFSTEHRYYGESNPFNELTAENLQYLSSRQALADIAKFINTVKLSPKFTTSKVVVVGGSYAGNLAAWMKLLYPDQINAAIASSAPVLAKVDFFEYLETVADGIEKYGTTGCLLKISKMFKRYEELLQTESGIKQLKKEEQICDYTDMNKWENQQFFFSYKIDLYMFAAQYGRPENFVLLCKESDYQIRETSIKATEYASLWNEKENCFDLNFEKMIEYSIKPKKNHVAWIFQTCTEFGYYQTSSSKKQPFTDNVSLEYFYKICKSLFGSEFDGKRIKEGVSKTNALYGGLNPNVSHVVFVNGDMDPWHRLGVLKNISNDAPAKLIPRSSHCRDLHSEYPDDDEELKAVRRYTQRLVKEWIGGKNFASSRYLLSD